MIERLTGMPPGTVRFRATGEIESEDYEEVLAPALREALEAGGGLRTLSLIEDLEEIEPGALWARAIRLFLWLIPGEARVFPRAELEQAKAWVVG